MDTLRDEINLPDEGFPKGLGWCPRLFPILSSQQ